MDLEEYLRKLQSFEEYAFTFDEVKQNTLISESTLRKALNRLTKTNEILNLRKGFYLILPPRYQSFTKLPLSLYVDKLFRYIGRPYYVALFSAAQYHGASHQRIQQDYVINQPPMLRDITKGSNKIRFWATDYWPKDNIVQLKSDAGNFNISSPALTLVDLVHYQSKIGGLNRIMPVLEELKDRVTKKDLTQLLKHYLYKSTLQRLGFLLEELDVKNDFTEMIFNKLSQDVFYPVLLSPNKLDKPGTCNNRWKIDVNEKIDSDI
jgi:predicted transcriptional regulator of viral defense system